MRVVLFVVAGAVLVAAGVLLIARRYTVGRTLALWSPMVRGAVEDGEMSQAELGRRGAWFMAVPMGIGLTIFGIASVIAGIARA